MLYIEIFVPLSTVEYQNVTSRVCDVFSIFNFIRLLSRDILTLQCNSCSEIIAQVFIVFHKYALYTVKSVLQMTFCVSAYSFFFSNLIINYVFLYIAM